jgi:hypothetical protein
MPSIERLTEIAEAATPGPWHKSDGKRVSVVLENINPGCGYDSHCVALTHSNDPRIDAQANAEFIATFNPTTVALIWAVVKAADEALKEYDADFRVQGTVSMESLCAALAALEAAP